ncbi:MAG: hypothetical protein AAF845_05430 [Bacteroidota bacterium]
MSHPAQEPDIRIAIFPEDRFALAQFHGRANGGDVLAAGSEIVHHPDWQSGFTEVWDVRAATVSVSPPEVKALGDFEKDVKGLLEGSVTLIIVDRPMIRYSLQFYAQMVRPLGRQLQICRTAEEAAEILGIDALPALPEAAPGV